MPDFQRQVRAVYDDETITVYQAYNREIANQAVLNQTFIRSSFKLDRMTWIKPSFLWMMYRSGWGSKANQEHILSIKLARQGFDHALIHGCLSHFDPNHHSSVESWKRQLSDNCIRIQWDPEKDIFLNNLNYRSIQIGLSGYAIKSFVHEWIVSIQEITPLCKSIYEMIKTGQIENAKSLLPKESNYPYLDKMPNLTS